MPEDTPRFTEFLIDVSHREELQEELRELRAGTRESFTGWDLTPDQLDILRRGDAYEILTEVRTEHADAEMMIWVGGGRPITAVIMPPPPPDE